MNNQEKKYELIKFEDGEFSLDVNVSPDEETVWLSANEIALLFNRDPKTIRKHINNVFEENEVDINSNTQKMRIAGVDQRVVFYSLNVIISVGYRVKSKRGILFRRWVTSVLKKYLLNGYSINNKRCIECQENIITLNNKVNNLIGNTNVLFHTAIAMPLGAVLGNSTNGKALFHEKTRLPIGSPDQHDVGALFL